VPPTDLTVVLRSRDRTLGEPSLACPERRDSGRFSPMC
jgi:hypothetical protein